MAASKLVINQFLFIIPTTLLGALFGILMASPAAIAEEAAMILIPQQPVEPSLWWKEERLEQGWVENIQVDTDGKQVIVIINPSRWLAADYLQRFSFLFKLGTEARSQNFNLILHNRRAEKIAEEFIAQVVGRPSLTGPSRVSPEIKARVPEKLKKALEKEAKRQGQTPSALIRQALEEFLDTA